MHLFDCFFKHTSLNTAATMPDPTYPLFPVVAFLAFVLGLVPLPWHLQAWNAGTCIFMLWASLSSFVKFVNAVIWNGNMENVAPVWCDIGAY